MFYIHISSAASLLFSSSFFPVFTRHFHLFTHETKRVGGVSGRVSVGHFSRKISEGQRIKEGEGGTRGIAVCGGRQVGSDIPSCQAAWGEKRKQERKDLEETRKGREPGKDTNWRRESNGKEFIGWNQKGKEGDGCGEEVGKHLQVDWMRIEEKVLNKAREEEDEVKEEACLSLV